MFPGQFIDRPTDYITKGFGPESHVKVYSHILYLGGASLINILPMEIYLLLFNSGFTLLSLAVIAS